MLRLIVSRLIALVAIVVIYSSLKITFVAQVDDEVEEIDLPVKAQTTSKEARNHHATSKTVSINGATGRFPKAAAAAAATLRNETRKSGEIRKTDNNSSPHDRDFTDCHHDFVGLTEYAASKLCFNQTAEVCDSLTCRSLLTGTGNDLHYGIARQLMSSRPASVLPDSYFINATKDCESFKRERGYHLTPLSSEEADFPLAFNLIVHTNAEQVEGQLRALYRPQNSICIHVDGKTNVDFRAAMDGIANCFDNVFIASKLERLSWGGYSRLQADINCMRDQLNISSSSSSSSSRGRWKQWKYLINTAGLAFPLKTIGEMVKTLKIYNGANDVEAIYGRRVIKSRYEKEWIEVPDRRAVYASGRRNPKPPHDLTIVRGSAYAVFSRGFVRFILEDRKAIDLLRWARKTWSPDELYWATLHHTYSNPQLHTPGGYSGYPSDKPWLAVYANWKDDGEMKCRGKRVRSVCVFGVRNLPDLVNRREFFANKFYRDFEPLALQCLSAWIRQKEACPPHFDDKFYRSLPFIK